MAELVVNGVKLHVQRMGGGAQSPVVFLHGLVMDNLSSWYFTVANRVARRVPVILYDYRGHGRSERPAQGYDVATMVADLHALLDELKVDKAQLVGNSYGGQLALAYAAEHPERVERIVLIDAHTGGAGWRDQMVATMELQGEQRDSKIAAEFASWLGRHSERKRNRLAKAAAALVNETSFVDDLRRSQEITDERLRLITCPIHAMYGSESDVLACGQHIDALLENCELTVLDGCSHSVLWEALDTVRDQVLRWCAPRRYLFVVPPLTGHINPTISVGRELAARGHTVAWVGHRRTLTARLPEGVQRYELDDELSEELSERVTKQIAATRGAARLKLLWEAFFVPLARSMVPQVAEAAENFQPDVMVVDQQTVAGAIVARQRGVAWATSATTSASVVDSLASLPKVRQWQQALLAELQLEAGLEVIDLERSHQLTLAFTARELLGHDADIPEQVRFVGPSVAHRQETTPFPWEQLADTPRVLVSLGTVNAEAGERFYGEVMQVAREIPVQFIVVAPAELVTDPPDNVIIRDFVPQLALLQRVNAVVCHGGHNTVVETLAHGLPLVIAPIRDDQPVVAQQVADAGVGVRVKFGRVRAAKLRAAIEQVLTDEAMRAEASRVRDMLAAAGGAAAAARLLEDLV